MTITFEENDEVTTWNLSAEDYRLLEALRARLVVEKPPTPPSRERVIVPRFATVSEMIHTHIADSLFLDQIRVEAQDALAQAAQAAISAKRAEISAPTKGGRPVLQAENIIPDSFGDNPTSKPGILNTVKSFFS
jgi:hypothetical protein